MSKRRGTDLHFILGFVAAGTVRGYFLPQSVTGLHDEWHRAGPPEEGSAESAQFPDEVQRKSVGRNSSDI
jgi:hypothetical protein